MIKHIGKHNQRRVAIVYRQVPEEDHMALIMYTDSLPQMLHDESMKVLESEIGQNAKDLADALYRHIMPDGNNCLVTLHRTGFLKKVPCNQIIVTPTNKATIRLDELNSLMAKIEAGGEAAQQLADIDANRGTKGVLQEGRELGEPKFTVENSALSDADIANQRLEQAKKMESDANLLLEEAARLKQEAQSLLPTVKPKNVRTTKTKKAATQE